MACDSQRACPDTRREGVHPLGSPSLAHRELPFDAIVIIRGGGAVTDLTWLNDLELARRICRLPIPVLTGIGHERDSTILDEVAYRRFDTPSKVANHIMQSILDLAKDALADLERIEFQVQRIVTKHADQLAAEKQRIEAQIRLGLVKAEAGMERLGNEIRMGSAHQIETVDQLLGRIQERILLGSDRVIERTEGQLAGSWESVRQTARLRVERQLASCDQLGRAVTLNASQANRACAVRDRARTGSCHTGWSSQALAGREQAR